MIQPPLPPTQGTSTIDVNPLIDTDTLIEYPCLFPIKVMGTKVEGFVETMVALAQQFDPALDASTIELRPSSGGKYLGITLTITATSRAQLDGLYRAFSSHPMVKMVL